jgi:hypothetical protein
MPVYGFSQADTYLILAADDPETASREAVDESPRWDGVVPSVLPDQLIGFFGFTPDCKKVVTAKGFVIPG